MNNNISLGKKALEEVKKSSQTWEIGSLNQVGVCSTQENGQISGREFFGEIKERKFYDKAKNIYKLTTRNRSVKLFTGEGRDLLDIITSPKDYYNTMKLVRSLNSMNTIMISVNKRKAAVPATKKSLHLIIGGTERKAIELFNKLAKLGIVREDHNGKIFFNPVYTLASNGITPEMYILFKEELDKVLPKAAIRDLQTIIYYNMHPEEMMKELEDGLTEEDVIEKARKFEPIMNVEEEQDEIVKAILEAQKETKAKREAEAKIPVNITLDTSKRTVKDILRDMNKNNTTANTKTCTIPPRPIINKPYSLESLLKNKDADTDDMPLDDSYMDMY